MFASVLHLDRKAVKALRITDAYALHRVIYSLYEDVRSEQEKSASKVNGVLYADQGGDHMGRKILLLANRQPLARVNDQYGQVITKAIMPSFLDYPHYRFKVIINPTRRNSQTRQLLPIKDHQEIMDWFIDRSQNNWGFQVVRTQLQLDRIQVLQCKNKNQQLVTVAQAHLQGVLTVTDKVQFTRGFTEGVGRARAYGCGLLQIVPFVENPFA